MAKKNKAPSQKRVEGTIGSDNDWKIVHGELRRYQGRPTNTKSLFQVMGEKIPFEFLSQVKSHLKEQEIDADGVYIAHDSMGYPRYIGRGSVFDRLRTRLNAQPLELRYFSFFIIKDKVHEREVETIMIRAAGPLLDFNDRKVRLDIQPGAITDFEAGAKFVERQSKKGRKRKSAKKDTQ